MKTNTTRPFLHLPWLAVLLLDCSTIDPDDDFRQSATVSELLASTEERRLEEELMALDDDDVVIRYHEGSPSMRAHVDVSRLSRLVEDLTVELQLVATLPDGTVTTHELVWPEEGEGEAPWVDVPVIGLGRYEVVIAGVAIDGRVLERPAARGYTHLLSEAEAALVTGELTGGCGPGITYHGNQYNNTKHGTDSNDVMHFRAGFDTGYGYGCNDTLYGGEGDDTLWGGDDDDACHGGGGFDLLISCEYVIP